MDIEIDVFEDVPMELSSNSSAYRLTIDGEPVPANPKRSFHKSLSWFTTFASAVEATAKYLNVETHEIGWVAVFDSNDNITGWNGYLRSA